MGGNKVMKCVLKEVNGMVWIALVWLMVGR